MAADFLSREVAVGLTCAMFAFILPLPVVAGVWLVCILTEGGDTICYRGIERARTPAARRLWQAALLMNSLAAFTAFSLQGVLAWETGDTMLRFIALLTLVGALLNVSTARSIHLPCGFASGLPPAIALGWIAAGGFSGGQGLSNTALASVATIILLGYFVAALTQNHRMQADLASETARARDASAAKSRFISEMSHEMRTPLNAIGGLSAILRDAADPSTRDAATRIESAARELSGLVDEVFDLSAAAEGQLRARPVAVDVRGEARMIATLLAMPGAAPGDMPPVSVAADVPPALTFDPVLLQKILRLVAAEAPHRANAGPVPESVALALADAGCALAVTLRFRRGVAGAGPPPRTDAGQSLGTELLPILTGLAGARLEWPAESPQATLTLAVQAASLPTDMPAAYTPRPDGSTAPLAALVVDDIATNRFILVQMLRKLQIDATEADSGEAALTAMRSFRFDVVLLDMNMPGMDGVETFGGIRALNGAANPGGSDVPVIAMTAGGVGNRDRFLGVGLDGYVAKPLEIHRLKAEIEAVLAARPSRSSRATVEGTPRPDAVGGGTAERPKAVVSSDYPSAHPDAPAP